ncbi:MAG: HPr(Ser) kinase/phosphatase [Lentisphaerae bacterium]|nr:HPr(Ser) kinase/phosphatase [Lentisphaerota bacterium]
MDKESIKRSSVTVRTFLAEGARPLSLELVHGERWLDHSIRETAIHRPGLPLAGFFRYFAHRRIQCLGLAEAAYLSSLSDEERRGRLRALFQKKIPCVVMARNRHVFPEMPGLSDEFRVPILKTKMITKHFVNAATIIMENLSAPRMKVQGTMIEHMGVGVLIEGKPGAGKSEIALALIMRGAALVSDDITALRVDSSGALIASAVDVTRYHMEIRGVGIVHVPSLFGVASVRGAKKLDLVISLCAPGTRDEDNRDGEVRSTRGLLGVEVPQVYVPVAPGRDLANVVETAALDHKLRVLGHDAAKELDERLMSIISRGAVGSD